jgi:hypothetical protein
MKLSAEMCQIPHNTPSIRTGKIYCRLAHKADHLGSTLHYIKINHGAVLRDIQSNLEDYGRTFVRNVGKYPI